MRSIITVFYDGLCPLCIESVTRCRQMMPDQPIHWFDITGQQEYLRHLGIDPTDALIELYLLTADGRIVKGIDSYSYLLRMMPYWHYRLLGLLLRFTPLHYVTTLYYRRSTVRRLRKSCRYPPDQQRCGNAAC